MRPAGRLTVGILALAAGSIAALGQSAVISARSGLIHYVEGEVYVGDQAVDSKFGSFPEVKENQILKTDEGRAEVLLTPGVFLRLAENSSFRMITNRLIDTRLEFLSGSAIIEADDILKDNSITVVYQDATVHVAKKGLYRIDASPAELRVFDGLADVTSGGNTVEVKEGHLLAFDTMAVHRFDKTTTDALNRWSERRAEYVSMANVSAANSLRTSMFSGDPFFSSGWYFNPFFGMYTFVPGLNGMGYSPFYSPYGYAFWNPFNVYMAYMPGYYYNPYYGGGYGYGNGYSGVYNAVNYRSVPSPSHSGSIGSVGSGSSASVGHAGSHSGGSVGSVGNVSSGTISSSVGSAPVSHGGSVGGGGGGGGHH
ncbi:MAG TPA: hypothetical protein VKR61_00175 [Bryobacteraceae bacterium]|nr:hypothetical protein [Bryobacteraceae bacterium]